MKARDIALGAAVGLSVGALGMVVLWRELHHIRSRLNYYEEKEARMRAHLQRREELDDNDTSSSQRSSGN